MHLIFAIILFFIVISILTVIMKIALYLFFYLVLLILATIFFGRLGFLICLILEIAHAIYTYKNDDFFN